MIQKPEFRTGIKPETLENKAVTLANKPQKIAINCFELYLLLEVLVTIHLKMYFRISRFVFER